MKKAVKIPLIIILVLFLIIAAGIGIFFLLIDPDINIMGAPDLDEAQLTSISRTIRVLDINGAPIDDALYARNKIYVKISDVKPYTVNAFISIEDKRFSEHSGIDYKRVASALLSNIKSRSFREGASTISQQLIKNTHLSNEKTLRRKIIEMRLARQLEKRFSKDRILEEYFNILYFGSGIKGLGTACRVMFDKTVSELTLAQSAALASIINNPTKYSPYKNSENLEERKVLVLSQMLDQGYISQAEFDSACAEKLIFSRNKQNRFIGELLRSACEQLSCSEKELFLNNYTFSTFYNPKISKLAQNEIKNSSVSNADLHILVLDNASGGVVCDESSDDKNVEERRCPASTIKPFISYAPALESGYNPLSQIKDEPTQFGDYSPRNYKNVYRGWLSMRDCLIYSSNIAAVKLMNDVGIDNCVECARSFGIELSDDDKTLPAALGGLKNGVTLREIANAYRTLANGGIHSEIRYLSSINDSSGITVMDTEARSQRVIGDDSAYILTDILQDCAHNGTAKALKNINNIAAKTGTNGDSNGNYDCYCVAYTAEYTVAVHLSAKDRNSPIDNSVTGAYCAKIISNLFSAGALSDNMPFKMPNSVAYYEIDAKTMQDTHEVYLADPLLPKRYRTRALMSKNHLPIRNNIDYIDYFDEMSYNDYDFY